MFVDGFRIAQALAGGGSCKEDDPGEGMLRRDILAQILVVQKDGFFSKRASLDEWVGVKVDLIIWDHALAHS